MQKIKKTDKEWKKLLGLKKYHILRKKGTEPRFSGKHLKQKEHGLYVCAACGNELFDSKTKYDSKSGWPSFWDAFNHHIELKEDTNHGMNRVEVTCAKCGGHLGHLFEDGPEPTKQRYCINSAALDLKKD